MKSERLISLLRQIEKLVAVCLKTAGERFVSSPQARIAVRAGIRAKNALPDRIAGLRDKGFFTQPKTSRDVHGKLNPTYACNQNRVSMALLRLVKRKKLRKASKKVDGKNQVAYVW